MIKIKEVSTKKDLKRFIDFNIDLYKGNKYAVPELAMDLANTLSDKNAAKEFCDSKLFLAYNESGEIVGRIAGIINHKANTTWCTKNVRFGWIDFIDDIEVSRALLDAVEQWGKAKGMNCLQGPLGFTDMDREGMLIEGFEELSTMATYYNYPYYPKHMEQLGMEKDADWVEYQIQVPNEIPQRLQRIANIVKEKLELHFCELSSVPEILDKYGIGFFDCINAAFKPLFGYSELSDRQKRNYLAMFKPILDKNLLSIILDKNDRVVAVGAAMPSMSRALQKSNGKLFPFGWWHLLKALKIKHASNADLLLAAVLPEYQGKGVNALFITDFITKTNKEGYKFVETNPELELNEKVQSQWTQFETRQHRRRRCFKRTIS